MEEKGSCRHGNTSTLKSVSNRGSYVRKLVKVQCTLRVMLNVPYIGVESVDYFHEKRCLLRRPLKMTWTVEIESGRAPMR